MKTTTIQSGSVAIDPRKIDTRDLVEAYYMLIACATLLRQSFGIVGLTNTLLESPLTESELESFANQFNLVHKTVNTVAHGLKVYIDGREEKAN